MADNNVFAALAHKRYFGLHILICLFMRRFRFAAILIALIGSGPVSAQFFLNGSALAYSDSCYQLTPAVNWMVGSIWNPNKIDLRQDFDLVMEVFLGCTDLNGADGMVFGLQPVSTSIGQAGGGIGFGGVAPSLGVEIDTYQNFELGDPAADHIAIMRNGAISHTGPGNLAGPIQARAASSDIENCRFYDLRISWDASARRFDVYFDCQLRLTYTGDIINTIFGGDPFVFWGFTSATGGGNNDHRVCFSYTTFLDRLQDVVVCPGGQVQLRATGGIGYEWTPAAGLSNPNIANPLAAPATTTTYQVRITDACNRPFTDDVKITVAGNPVFFDLGPDTTICDGAAYLLDASTPTATYAWSTGAATPTLSVTTPGEYSVTVTRTDTVCTAEDVVNLNVRPLPELELGRDTSLCEGQSIRLGAVFPEAVATWQDGSQADSFLITAPGRYRAVLEHPCGIIADDLEATYENCREVYLPNAFSPNDDGVNDRFYPQDGGDVQEIVSLTVYDRWGGMVFQRQNFVANESGLGWKGDHRGRPLGPGVYLWVMHVRFRDGYSEERTGEVMLVQ